MSLVLYQSATAIAPGNSTSFKAAGGVEPYVYSVFSGGGTINASTGLYTAPANEAKVVVKATDSLGAIVTAPLKVMGTFRLFCDVIQNAMLLADDQVYIYNEKILVPKDDRIYIAVKILIDKPFSNINRLAPNGTDVIQTVNSNAQLMVDILSRGMDALNRRLEVVMAFQSNYAKQQMAANGFSIGKIPSQFVSLNAIDGAAIPFRYNITVGMQHALSKVNGVPYYSTFEDVSVQPDP